MSIAIVGFVVIVLAPITFMQFGSTKSPSSGEDDKVCYAPNYGNASECPSNLGVPPEGLGASEPVLEAGVSPDKKDEELSGIWRGLDDKLVLIFFRAGNVMMEKPDSGIVGEYGVDGNRIVFCWENGEKQTVRYEIGGNMLHLAFDDGQMVMLRKQ